MSQVFEIPIKEFESKLDDDFIKGKKEEILNLLKNHNEIKSIEEYYKINTLITGAIKQGDLELLEILLNEEIEVEEGISYKINKTKKTASLFKIEKRMKNFLVPRTIKYEFNDYLVTSIIGSGELSPKIIDSIEFDEESSVHTIYERSFEKSYIECISIPKSLVELKENWSYGARYLIKIIVSPLNDRFKFSLNKYLLGKTDEKSKIYDVILFARRDISEAVIPSYIKIISSYAFYCCEYLKKVVIQENSQLKEIQKFAFAYTEIEEIYIPKDLIIMGDNWCFKSKLTKITISPLNDRFLYKDEKYFVGKTDVNSDNYDILFFARYDMIEKAFIPSNIKIIKSYAFFGCKNLRIVVIPKNSQLQTIEKYAFYCLRIESIFIPSCVTTICDYAFSDCTFLQKVDIPKNSQLKVIDNSAFSNTHIDYFFIPPNVIKIHEETFYNCKYRFKIEIPINSNLRIIESKAFMFSNIESIYIPTFLTELKEGWCECTRELKEIIVSPSNSRFIYKEGKYLLGKTEENNSNYDILLFARRDIEEAIIPSNIKIISSYSFEKCTNLHKIEISPESQLKIIERNSFSETNIETIFIPSTVLKICECAFLSCQKLTNVVFPLNSKLKIIEYNAFAFSRINEMHVPPTVSEIGKKAFNECAFLRKFEIPINSQLQTIEESVFSFSNIETICFSPNILKISKFAFCNCQCIEKIEIPLNSRLKIIESNAFSGSGIKEIYIPTFLTELKEGWCECTRELKEIIVSPSNSIFIYKERKYLLGKTEENSSNYDILLLARRDIEEAIIPSNIKIISSYSFEKCTNLHKIEISPESQLKIIERNSFSETNIETIFIPSTVLKICECAFYGCINLRKIDILAESQLQTIERNAFVSTKIESIYIPSTVSKIGKSAFYFCENLQIIEFSEGSMLPSIDSSFFEDCPEFIAMIPHKFRIL